MSLTLDRVLNTGIRSDSLGTANPYAGDKDSPIKDHYGKIGDQPSDKIRLSTAGVQTLHSKVLMSAFWFGSLSETKDYG
jgi:hypothetical protein